MMKTHAHNYFTYFELNVHIHRANERDVLVVVVAVFVVAA